VTVSIDGNAGANFTNASSGAVVLSTSNAGDAIVVFVVWAATTARPATQVTGIASTHTTGWTRRFACNTTGGGDSLGGADGVTNMECWWGLAAAGISSESISVTMDHEVDAGVIAAFGVSSTAMAYSGSPFSVNGSTPYDDGFVEGSDTAATPGPITTTEGSGLALTAQGDITGPTNAVLPTGYTQIQQQNNPGSGSVWWSNINVGYEAFSSALAGYSNTWSPTGSTYEHFVVSLDALVDASIPYVRRRPTSVSLNRR
jgi:hypothetical protein